MTSDLPRNARVGYEQLVNRRPSIVQSNRQRSQIRFITMYHLAINSISYWDFQKNTTKYDCIITYSSIKHSGLGRYGDPLDPNGDVHTMQEIHKNLVNNGLLIWGAPVGHDALVWNVHRIYGKIRLPLIFNGFKELEWIDFDKDILLNSPLNKSCMQPVIVLSKIT